MSSRKSFFFRQRVTHDELNAAFDDIEAADHNLAADLGESDSTLGDRASKTVTFHVRASEAGIVGLYAHTYSPDDYGLGDIALDAVEVAGEAAPAVVGQR